MKCNGDFAVCGARCKLCGWFFDGCNGHPDWGDYNGRWLPLEEIEILILAEIVEQEKKAKFTE